MDDDETTDSNTIATKAVLTMDGCCAKHRHIRLRGHDAQGNVVQRDSCPECDKELAAARRSLQERQRQLDQQLKALEETGEGSNRGGRNMNGNGNGSGSNNNSGHNRPQYNNNGSNNNSTSNRGTGIAPDNSPYVPQPPPPTPTWGNPYEHHNYYGGHGGHGGHPPPPGVNTPDGSKSNNNSSGNGMYPPHPYGYPPSHAYPHQSPYGQYPPPPPPQQAQDSESSKFLLTMLRQREEELATLRIRLDTAQQTIQEQSIELATVRSQFEFAQQTKESEVKIAHLQAQAAAAERFQEESKKLKEAHNQQVMQMQSDFEKTLERLALNASSNHLPSAAGATPSTDADSTANSITNSVASGPNLNVSANTNVTNQPKPKMEQPKKLQEPDGLDESTVGTDALDIYQNDSVSTNQTKNTSTPIPVPSMDKKPAATPTAPAPVVNRPWKKDVAQEAKAAAAAVPVNPDWDVVEEEEAEDDGDVFTELPNKYKPVTTAQPRAHPPAAKPPSDTFEPRVLGPGDDDDDISHHPGETPDEASLVQTVASSTYGEDRQKVNNQTLLDPYGDQGVYSGMILRSTGMPHGRGQMVYDEDGRIYDGDWRHGRWHGYGRASFSNGDSYEGEYKFDQRHGRGIYKWHDGRVYDGHFNEDKRHGQGVFTWPDGAVYDGAFVNGQREGHGKYTFADGGEYVGNWKDGRYDGFGTCVWEDKRRYEGEWRNGMAHGHGIETYPNGNIRHQGQWVDDEPVR